MSAKCQADIEWTPSTRARARCRRQAVRVVRRVPEDVGKNVALNVDSEGHGHISSSFGGLDHFGRAAADHKGRSIGRPRNDRWHDGCVRHAQAAKAVDAKLAVHDGIGAGTDLRGAPQTPF
jgi:hypothetical protein